MKKILQCCLWVFVILWIQIPLMAQTTVVNGTVVSEHDKSPLPGVTVALKGRMQGTVTDSDGKFSINAESTDVLVFSFIGFETYEIQVGTSTDISVTMKESLENLQE